MATSLQTKVFEPKIKDIPNVLSQFPSREKQVAKVTAKGALIPNTESKPQIQKQVTARPEAVPFTRKKYSRLTMNLISSAFILLAGEASIYFHSVIVQKNSNLLQSQIIEMKEQDYRLNVELAKAKELTKVEKVAVNDLQMKPSINSKINYLILPEQVTNKEYLITRVSPEKRRLSINIGY